MPLSKCLVLSCVLLILPTLAQSPQPASSTGRKQISESNRKQGDTQNGPPHATVPSAAAAQPSQAASNPNTANWDCVLDYLRRAFAPANLSNWALCLFAAIAAGIALRTLGAIRKQADIAQRSLRQLRRYVALTARLARSARASADAAKASADALINSERAWVVPIDIARPAFVEMVAGGNVLNYFVFDLINQGRTVARLTGPFKARYRSLPRSADLDNVPDYGGMGATTPEPIFGRVLAPGERNGVVLVPLGESVDKRVLADLETGQLALYVYVSLTYYDSFEPKRELQFGYTYKPRTGNEPARWAPIAKKEYNKQT